MFKTTTFLPLSVIYVSLSLNFLPLLPTEPSKQANNFEANLVNESYIILIVQ